MVTLNYLITVSLFLFLFLGILIYYIIVLSSIPVPPPHTHNSGVVTCEPDKILEAWIQDIPDKEGCPPFTNNFIIATDQIQMFEKNFMVDSDTDCCFFSNDKNQRKYLQNPFICIVRTDAIPFTLDELNQKPYAFDNNTTIFTVPPCDKVQCLGLIRFDILTENGITYGLYKLFREEIGASDDVTGSSGFEEYVFQMGPDCTGLVNIKRNGSIVIKIVDGGIDYVVPQSQLPDFVTFVARRFTKQFGPGRFYPIPGANPPLSEQAKNS